MENVHVMSKVKIAGTGNYMNRVWEATILDHDVNAGDSGQYLVHIPAFGIDLWVDFFYVHHNWTGPHSDYHTVG